MKTTLNLSEGQSAVTLETVDGQIRLGIEFYDGSGAPAAGSWADLTEAETWHVIEALQDELGDLRERHREFQEQAWALADSLADDSKRGS